MDITLSHWQKTTLRANTHSDNETDTNTTRRWRQSAVCIHHRDSDGASPLTHARRSYPKHVWSPAGGWYTQPANWKQNTAIMGAVLLGITAMAWSVSADREHRDKMPEVWRWARRQEGVKRNTMLTPDSLADSSPRDGGAERFASTSGRRRGSRRPKIAVYREFAGRGMECCATAAV